MSSLFCVIATEQVPRLYVSQSTLSETLRALRSWPYSHTRYSYIFEPKRMPSLGNNEYGDPTGHLQLPLVGKVTPTDAVETHQYCLAGALDDLPPDEAILRAQAAIDYLHKKLVHYENLLSPPKESETTGTLISKVE